MALELGDGYRFETSMVTGEEGSDGDLDRIESGDEGDCCKESISGSGGATQGGMLDSIAVEKREESGRTCCYIMTGFFCIFFRSSIRDSRLQQRMARRL